MHECMSALRLATLLPAGLALPLWSLSRLRCPRLSGQVSEIDAVDGSSTCTQVP
jgi:hypothetical protein